MNIKEIKPSTIIDDLRNSFAISPEMDENNYIITDKDINLDNYHLNIELVSKLLGYMSFFKFCHWSAKTMDLHKALDDFYKILSEYVDEMAEVLQGIDEQFNIEDFNVINLNGEKHTCLDALNMLKQDIQNFVEDCSTEPQYIGAVDISTTFLKDIAQYTYLFRLCKD